MAVARPPLAAPTQSTSTQPAPVAPTPAIESKSEEKAEANLPNVVVLNLGFLQPYIDFRSENGKEAVWKAQICENLQDSFRETKTLDKWIEILDRLQKLIKAERPTNNFSVSVKSAAASLGLGDAKWLYLGILISTRTFICQQLLENNPIWKTRIEKEFNEALELGDKITDAKNKSIAKADVAKWEADRTAKLKNLSKFYYKPANIELHGLNQLEGEVAVFGFEKSNIYIPEHLQDDFHEKFYQAVLAKYFERKPGCETYQGWLTYLSNTYKDSSISSIQSPSAGSTGSVLASLPPTKSVKRAPTLTYAQAAGGNSASAKVVTNSPAENLAPPADPNATNHASPGLGRR